MRQPGWKLLIDHLGHCCDTLLAAMRVCDPGKPQTINDLVIEWRTAEKFLLWAQNETAGTIEARNTLIRELLADRLPPDKIDELVTRVQTGV